MAKAKATSQDSAAQAEAAVSVGAFRYAEVHREKIQEAPYNPRTITDDEIQRLAGGMDDLGLLEPLVWNERTGNLVGGHQRLAILDAKYGQNYLIPCAIVDLDEAQEKRANILLNNQSAQGSWDIAQLESLFRDGGVNPWEVGFSNQDIIEMFPPEVGDEFATKYLGEEVEMPTVPGESDSANVAQTSEEVAAMKAAKAEYKDADRESLRNDHHITVVFNSPTETQAALRALNLNPSQNFLMAQEFFKAVEALSGVVRYRESAPAPDTV